MISLFRQTSTLLVVAVAFASCGQHGGASGVVPSETSGLPGTTPQALSDRATGAHAIYVSDFEEAPVFIIHGSTTKEIKGDHTRLTSPIAIAREPSGDLVVVNPEKVTAPQKPGSVVTLPAKAGNVHPKHVIKCHQFAPWGVAVDASSNIWIADSSVNRIAEYAPDAQGCATPIAVIQGAATQLSSPTGLALNSQGQIVVGNFVDDSIEVFAKGATGNVPPIVRIAGGNTKLINSEGLAVDANDNIWVTIYGSGTNPAQILEFDRTAKGNAAPKRVISGPLTLLSATIGIAVDPHTGEIYACNGGSQFTGRAVLVFSPDANGNVAPIRQLLPDTFPTGIVLPN